MPPPGGRPVSPGARRGWTSRARAARAPAGGPGPAPRRRPTQRSSGVGRTSRRPPSGGELPRRRRVRRPPPSPAPPVSSSTLHPSGRFHEGAVQLDETPPNDRQRVVLFHAAPPRRPHAAAQLAVREQPLE